jgi:chromosome segregation ATPase
MNTDNR